jgi:hypothetical protein
VYRSSLAASLALLICTATSAWADIGETGPELDQRYGTAYKVVRYNLPTGSYVERSYRTRELHVTATIWNGRSQREIYLRPRPWSDAEIQRAMAANSWKGSLQVLSTSKTRMTLAFGNNLYATYNVRPNKTAFFTVSTAELAKAESIRNREEWFWRY